MNFHTLPQFLQLNFVHAFMTLPFFIPPSISSIKAMMVAKSSPAGQFRPGEPPGIVTYRGANDLDITTSFNNDIPGVRTEC